MEAKFNQSIYKQKNCLPLILFVIKHLFGFDIVVILVMTSWLPYPFIYMSTQTKNNYKDILAVIIGLKLSSFSIHSNNSQ